MITGKKSFFLDRCNQRGYSLEEVKDCIIEDDGEYITIDENHPSYPKQSKHTMLTTLSPLTQVTPDRSGPGTELKKLLSKIGITATPNCSCNARAKIMDKNGSDWCENNIDTIVGWLKEEATKRNLPFINYAAKLLIKKAIKNARKNCE
jgi:hypothetical protein